MTDCRDRGCFVRESFCRPDHDQRLESGAFRRTTANGDLRMGLTTGEWSCLSFTTTSWRRCCCHPWPGIPIRAAAAQTTPIKPPSACALERYRLANGQFPGDLQALVAALAPFAERFDTGEPYIIPRSDDDLFVLIRSAGTKKTTAALRAQPCLTKPQAMGLVTSGRDKMRR